MFNLTPNQLLNLWCELEDARLGVNTFGGDVAEIYAYTLQPYNPIAHRNVKNSSPKFVSDAEEQVAKIAGENLKLICDKFVEKRDVSIIVVGGSPITKLGNPIYHRVQVKVIAREVGNF